MFSRKWVTDVLCGLFRIKDRFVVVVAVAVAAAAAAAAAALVTAYGNATKSEHV